MKLVALNIQIPVWLELVFYTLLTSPGVVWSTVCSSSCRVTQLSPLMMRSAPPSDTWVTKLPIKSTGVPGEGVSAVAALRFQMQSLLSYIFLMATAKVENFERKHSAEPNDCLSSRPVLIYQALCPLETKHFLATLNWRCGCYQGQSMRAR